MTYNWCRNTAPRSLYTATRVPYSQLLYSVALLLICHNECSNSDVCVWHRKYFHVVFL